MDGTWLTPASTNFINLSRVDDDGDDDEFGWGRLSAPAEGYLH